MAGRGRSERSLAGRGLCYPLYHCISMDAIGRQGARSRRASVHVGARTGLCVSLRGKLNSPGWGQWNTCTLARGNSCIHTHTHSHTQPQIDKHDAKRPTPTHRERKTDTHTHRERQQVTERRVEAGPTFCPSPALHFMVPVMCILQIYRLLKPENVTFDEYPAHESSSM